MDATSTGNPQLPPAERPHRLADSLRKQRKLESPAGPARRHSAICAPHVVAGCMLHPGWFCGTTELAAFFSASLLRPLILIQNARGIPSQEEYHESSCARPQRHRSLGTTQVVSFDDSTVATIGYPRKRVVYQARSCTSVFALHIPSDQPGPLRRGIMTRKTSPPHLLPNFPIQVRDPS